MTSVKPRLAYSLITIVLILAGCSTTPDELPTDFEAAPLMGMVYSTDNRPVQGMTITLDETVIVESDIEGRFIFPNVARGNHTIAAQKSGFEAIIYGFDFIDRTQVLHLQTMSTEELLRNFEDATERRDWREVDALIDRIERAGDRRAEFLFLAAIAQFLKGDREQVQKYLSELLSSGIHSEYIDRLQEISADEASFDSYRDMANASPAAELKNESQDDEVTEPAAPILIDDEMTDEAGSNTSAQNRPPVDDASNIFGQREAPPAQTDSNDLPPQLPPVGDEEADAEADTSTEATEAPDTTE